MVGPALVCKMTQIEKAKRTIPIVVVTSYPDRFTKKDVLAAGCESFENKPIDTRTFAGLVSEVVLARQMRIN